MRVLLGLWLGLWRGDVRLIIEIEAVFAWARGPPCSHVYARAGFLNYCPSLNRTSRFCLLPSSAVSGSVGWLRCLMYRSIVQITLLLSGWYHRCAVLTAVHESLGILVII